MQPRAGSAAPLTTSSLDIGAPPWRLSGTVVGVLLNDRPALEALGDGVHAAPYKAPPVAPVLYVKPRNTLARDGDTVVLPADVDAVEIGAAVGLVLGRPACRVDERAALDCVAAVVVVADLSVPHGSYYRPSVRMRARDGFCPIGAAVPFTSAIALDDLTVRIAVDGREVLCAGTRTLVRPAARLIAEITDFMTLAPGDVLLLGTPAGAPHVGASHAVSITVDGIGTLAFRLAAEETP